MTVLAISVTIRTLLSSNRQCVDPPTNNHNNNAPGMYLVMNWRVVELRTTLRRKRLERSSNSRTSGPRDYDQISPDIDMLQYVNTIDTLSMERKTFETRASTQEGRDSFCFAKKKRCF